MCDSLVKESKKISHDDYDGPRKSDNNLLDVVCSLSFRLQLWKTETETFKDAALKKKRDTNCSYSAKAKSGGDSENGFWQFNMPPRAFHQPKATVSDHIIWNSGEIILWWTCTWHSYVACTPKQKALVLLLDCFHVQHGMTFSSPIKLNIYLSLCFLFSVKVSEKRLKQGLLTHW